MAMMQYSDPYGPVVPTRTQMYSAGPAYGQVLPAGQSTGQLVTYGTSQIVAPQQQYASTDMVAYDRYLNSPPNDVMYTRSTKSRTDHMTDGWNGMWRQSCQPYVMSTQTQPPPQVYTQPVVQKTTYVQPQTMYVQQPPTQMRMASSTPMVYQQGPPSVQYSVGPAPQAGGYYPSVY